MRILPLILTTVCLSSALALPLSYNHTPSSSTLPASVSSGWKIEIVGMHGGSAPPFIALDSADRPYIHFCPPGEDRFAYKDEGNWTSELVALTVGGGICGAMDIGPGDIPYLDMAIPPEWDPLHFYLAAKVNGSWQFTEGSRATGDIVVDSFGIPHTIGMVRSSPGNWSVVYRSFAGGLWQTEVVETFPYSGASIGFSWGSLALDSIDRPRILHYDSARGDVRYAYRQDGGTWHVEVVDTIGNIAVVGRQGSLALDTSGKPVAAYSVRVNLTWIEVRYAVRQPGGWAYTDMGVRSLFPSVAVGPDGVTRLAMIVNTPTSYPIGLRHIDYYVLSSNGWQSERAVDDDGVDKPSMALDSCGNPHIAYYNQGWLKGVYYATKGNCTSNRPPTANAGGPYTNYEGHPLTLAATATDPDNDPLTYRWDFDNDGIADTSWSSSPIVQHVWGDDYTGMVRVEVSDNKTTSNATVTVTILNLPPTIDSIMIPAVTAAATLRIAGEKWHDVSAYLVDGGSETLVATLTRQPGKPQEVSFPVSIDSTKARSLRIAYTPDDDKVNGQPNGATPAWLTFAFDQGSPVEMHHTFNVQHSDTWNWTVSLNSLLAGRDIQFTATATDPGSDDLTFTWEWGDGTPVTAITYYNDGIAPDLYPSLGGTFPFTATDLQGHIYAMAGTYSTVLRVTDDDGGMKELLIVVIIV